jgi:hypothetical protein
VFERDLINHLVLQNLLLVQDLDGHGVARLRIPGKPDLGEGALAYGSAKLILPHTSLHLGCTHSLDYPTPLSNTRILCVQSNSLAVLCRKTGYSDCYGRQLIIETMAC